MRFILRHFEPFALDLWAREIDAWLPGAARDATWRKQTFWGGLYQMVTMTRASHHQGETP